MMNSKLPESFVSRMESQIGNEMPAFLNKMEQPPRRGIRFNTLKTTKDGTGIAVDGTIPWADDAWLLPDCSEAGAMVIHEAGAYYLQEPSAMIPASVLNAKPGEYVLDLCSAPGGKATQMGCAMRNQGLLVCNEPVLKRAWILSRNIERTGLHHTVITNAWPEELADKWPGAFDAVLVDAPCSGEGMFRRLPESREEWSKEKAEGCAERQRRILSCAARLVRPGGRLVYSTCTFNPDENERNVFWFLRQYPEFRLASFSLPHISAPEGMFTAYPHRIEGEGQFVSLMIRDGEKKDHVFPAGTAVKICKDEEKAYRNSFPMFPVPDFRLGKTLTRIGMQPDLKGIRIIRAGLHLAEIRGSVSIPDHASALMSGIPETKTTDLSAEQVRRYMAGETLESELQGWVILRYHGFPVGWGKGSGGILRNHYPKGLRGNHFLP